MAKGDPPDQHLFDIPGVKRIDPRPSGKRKNALGHFAARAFFSEVQPIRKSVTDRFLDDMQRMDTLVRGGRLQEPGLRDEAREVGGSYSQQISPEPAAGPEKHPIYVPSLHSLWTYVPVVWPLLPAKTSDFVLPALQFISADPQYRAAFLGFAAVALSGIPAYSAICIHRYSADRSVSPRNPIMVTSRRKAQLAQKLVIAVTVATSAVLLAGACRFAGAEMSFVFRDITGQTGGAQRELRKDHPNIRRCCTN